MRSRLALTLLPLAFLPLAGCELEPYCLTCEGADGGLPGDADVPDVGFVPDACAYQGIEQCNGLDDDCNGEIDDAAALVGDRCGSDDGACEAGLWECADGQLQCGAGAISAIPEACNGIDDDCDTVIDNGDPGGNLPCESGIGDCVSGTTHCLDGFVQCVGFVGPVDEICDGHDSDCDGIVDDGNPGGGAACEGDGEGGGGCSNGAIRCTGGALQCVVQDGPELEECDAVDNDCDGNIDEDFDLANDVNHCGDCSTACTVTNGRGRCQAGGCLVDFCLTDFWDDDGLYDNGCEYPCEFRGAEVCNGRDDDCDGDTDEASDLVPPEICALGGECAGTGATCRGVDGWQCEYGPSVSVDDLGDIEPETTCDGLDNDCDGAVDDSFADRGQACTRGVGVCQTRGIFVCNGGGDGLDCTAAEPPAGDGESCNGLDDDCDGELDEDAPDAWVPISGPFGDVEIYQFEASHPDATADDAGGFDHRPCSAPGRLPWTNVTAGEAATACGSIGARLCSEEEWQAACEALSSCSWSYGLACGTYQGDSCNGNDFDADDFLPGDQDSLLPTADLGTCYADWGAAEARIYDLSGNAKEWTEPRSPGVNPLRGGAYNNTEDGISCGADFTVAGDGFLFANVGFRCCRDN